jgi:hypothetical protein
MKNLLALMLFVTIQAAAQNTPSLLKGGAEKPSFTYTECFNNLKGKDRYCNRYDYTFYIKERELFIIETKTSHSDQPKKSTSYNIEYRVKIDDIAINQSLDGLKTSNEVYRIKNMEGSEQRFYKFHLFSRFTEGIKTTENGKPVGKERITLYADSFTDARAFLEYLLTE